MPVAQAFNVDTVKDKKSGMERDVGVLEFNESHGMLKNINLSCNFIDRKKLRGSLSVHQVLCVFDTGSVDLHVPFLEIKYI